MTVIDSSQIPLVSKTIGLRQTLRACDESVISQMFLALDAEEHVRARVQEISQDLGIPIIDFPTKLGLGKLCEIKVGCAVVGILKEGSTFQKKKKKDREIEKAL